MADPVFVTIVVKGEVGYTVDKITVDRRILGRVARVLRGLEDAVADDDMRAVGFDPDEYDGADVAERTRAFGVALQNAATIVGVRPLEVADE